MVSKVHGNVKLPAFVIITCKAVGGITISHDNAFIEAIDNRQCMITNVMKIPDDVCYLEPVVFRHELVGFLHW